MSSPPHTDLHIAVAYICTETCRFPAERLLEMGLRRQMDPEQFMDRVLVEYLLDMESLMHVLEYQLPVLIERVGVRLLIVDSVAANLRYGAEQQQPNDSDNAHQLLLANGGSINNSTTGNKRQQRDDGLDRQHRMWQLGQCLHRLAHRHRLPIVCVNQVTGAGDGSTPALGLWWSQCIQMRIMLEKREDYHYTDPGLESTTAGDPSDAGAGKTTAAERGWVGARGWVRLLQCPHLPTLENTADGPTATRRLPYRITAAGFQTAVAQP